IYREHERPQILGAITRLAEQQEVFDHFEKHAFERALQAGAEQCVNDDVVSPPWFGDLLPTADSVTFNKRQRRWRFRRTGFEAGEPAHGLEVGMGVARSLREFPKQDHVALHARAAESASESGAVAAVVAFAAEYKRAFAGQVAVETSANRLEASG